MTASEGMALVEWDWLYTQRAQRLHHATLTPELYDEINDGQLEHARIYATCGRSLYWPSIPGVFSRMSMPRCKRCCDRLGYHHGDGSPKNDPALRPLVEARIALGQP